MTLHAPLGTISCKMGSKCNILIVEVQKSKWGYGYMFVFCTLNLKDIEILLLLSYELNMNVLANLTNLRMTIVKVNSVVKVKCHHCQGTSRSDIPMAVS